MYTTFGASTLPSHVWTFIHSYISGRMTWTFYEYFYFGKVALSWQFLIFCCRCHGGTMERTNTGATLEHSKKIECRWCPATYNYVERHSALAFHIRTSHIEHREAQELWWRELPSPAEQREAAAAARRWSIPVQDSLEEDYVNWLELPSYHVASVTPIQSPDGSPSHTPLDYIEELQTSQDHLPACETLQDHLPGPSQDHLPGPSQDHLPGPSQDHLPGPSQDHLPGPSQDHPRETPQDQLQAPSLPVPELSPSEDQLKQDPTPHSTELDVGPYRPDTSPVSSWGSSPLVTLGSTESLASTLGFQDQPPPASPAQEGPRQETSNGRLRSKPKVWPRRVCGMTFSSPVHFRRRLREVRARRAGVRLHTRTVRVLPPRACRLQRERVVPRTHGRVLGARCSAPPSLLRAQLAAARLENRTLQRLLNHAMRLNQFYQRLLRH